MILHVQVQHFYDSDKPGKQHLKVHHFLVPRLSYLLDVKCIVGLELVKVHQVRFVDPILDMFMLRKGSLLEEFLGIFVSVGGYLAHLELGDK